MPCRLSMPNLLCTLILSAALGSGADLGVTSIRQPGASLDTSLRNEVEHAVGQASAWLAARQDAEGAWGVSNRVRLTSLALLALHASRRPGCSEATARAALWLDARATNRVDDLGAHAWRLLALAQLLPETPERPALLRRFADAGRPFEAGASADGRRLWAEALAAAGLGADPFPADDSAGRLDALAAGWPPARADNATAWQFAHLINRAGNGQLLRGGTPLDWRRDLAQRLVNTQRKAASGGGYWEASDLDAQLAETAFGLLALLEL